MSAPGYMIASNDTPTPSHPTTLDALEAKPVEKIPTVAIEKTINRKRLVAPKANGDLILKNALGNRHKKVDSATSINTDINTKPNDA